jgi:acyl-coenzyme A synthetase/AMP-(fatty) acid ligase
MDLSTRLATVPTLDPAAPAWQFDGRWRPWSYLSEATSTLDGALDGPAAEPGAQVGLLMRNRPEVAAAVIALLTSRRCLVTLSTAQPAATMAEELRAMRLPAVLAADRDLGPELIEACRAVGTSLLVVSEASGADPVAVRVRTEVSGDPHDRYAASAPEVAVRMLTSGTTGRPKRIELHYRSLEIEADSTRRYSGTGQGGLRLASGVAINWMPLVHVAGVRAVIASVLDGRRLSLMERFTVEDWVALIREHRPKTALLVPTTLRMIYDAGVPGDVFDSISAVFVGTAALDPTFAAEFSARYKVPVLAIYGATEFAGGVAGWTLRDWQRCGADKPDSVGRANAGIELRAVDPDSGAELPADQPGLLEVRGDQLAERGWVRTTDLARIDADGFLYILGRADDVIIRGGLKVRTADVAAALREHPAVHDAAVIGASDRRLGAVPVAAVELEPGADVDEPGLSAHLRQRLAAYQVPVRIAVLERLPRTPSMKVSQPELRNLLRLNPC